jgi:hypothetical protein
MIKITSKQDGFRRCGMAHSTQPQSYADDRFSLEELDILQGEPMLIVEIVEDEVQGIPHGLNARDTIKLVKEAGDIESLDVLYQGEDRKSVLDALLARRKELRQE